MCWPVAVALLLLGSLPAQAIDGASPRARQGGAVLTRDGKPWAGALVTFLNRDVPWADDVGAVDVVRCKTNARGRFRAQLLRGRSYTVWAQAKGGVRVTGVVENVIAGRPIKLVETTERAPLRIRFGGLRAWEPHGGLVPIAVSETHNVAAATLQLDADGNAVVPSLPGASIRIEARLPNGRPVFARRLRYTPQATGAALLSIRAPRTVVVAVQDESKRGIAKATILRDVRGRFFPCTKTDRDGRATLQVPRGTRHVRLLVRARGFGERAFAQTLRAGTMQPAGPEITMTLRSGGHLKGRVSWSRGEPARRQPLLLEGPVATGSGSWSQPRVPRIVVTDGNGTFWIPLPDVQHQRALRLEYRLTTAARAGVPFHSKLVLIAGTMRPSERREHDLGSIVVDELRAVRVHVTRADGSPARNAKVVLSSLGNGAIALRRPVDYVTDRRGDLALRLPSGAFRFGCVHEGAVAAGTLKTNESGRHEVKLRLSEPIELTGRVVDPTQQPIAGARVSWNLDPRSLAGAHPLLLGEIGPRRTRSRADGSFTLRLPMGDTVYYLWANVRSDGKNLNSQRNVVVHAGPKGAHDVEIVVQ